MLVMGFVFVLLGILGCGFSGGLLSGSWLIVGLVGSGFVGLLGVAGVLKWASDL